MDGTENQQDGITSVETKETSKTYTETEVVERERQARSNALADANRAKVEAEKANKAATDALARIAQIQRANDDADRERYRDDPEKLSAIEAGRRERDTTAKLEDTERELNEERDKRTVAESKVNDSTKERNAREIATRLNVNPDLLGDLSKLTDGSVEAIEVKAQMLPKVTETKDLNPDSNNSIGGKDFERVREAYIKNPDDRQNTARYMEFRAQQGR